MTGITQISRNTDILSKAFGHLQAGRLRDCQTLCAEALQRDAADGDAFYMLGMISYQVGDMVRAVANLTQAVRHRPLQPAYVHALGLAQDRSGDEAAAEHSQRTALQMQPEYPEALNALGIVLIKQARIADARDVLQRALALRPAYAEACLNLANCELAHGDGQAAEAHLRRALQHNPGLLPAARQLGMVLRSRGEVTQAPEAEQLLRQVLAATPGDAVLHHELGMVLQRLGRATEAIASYREAVRLRPEFAEAHNNLAYALAKDGQLEAAEAAYLEALRLDPQFIEARVNLGILHRQRHDYAAAVAQHEQALQVAPGHAGALLHRADALFALGRTEEALTDFQRVIDTAPDRPRSHYTIATLLQQHGAYDAALEHYRAAMRLDPADPLPPVNVAQLLLALGRFAEGWPAYLERRLPSVKKRIFGRLEHSGGDPFAANLAGQTIIIRGEQGLGDHIFFLRFAALVRARGARLVYHGMRQLLGMVQRTGWFERVAEFSEDAGPADRIVTAGDLPYLLGLTAADVPPLPLVAEASRVAAWRDRLAALGPAPYLGLTWRAGVQMNDLQWISLYKELPATQLARIVAARRGTWLALQRLPRAGEVAQVASAIGQPLHDLSTVNDDLEDMLALLSVLDEYVGVSNTNTHLRVSAGLGARVMVPYPPEWRWLVEGDASPWYPGSSVYRQSRQGDWMPAVERLIADLRAG